MVIASIDIQGGKVVQLRQGAEKVLERDNPLELAEEFDRYGEVAVIDLDAALGTGSNIEMIKPILRKADCRVGGGIRTPEQAKTLVSLGACKIIVGSSAFRVSGGGFGVNLPFLREMSQTIGRERLIVAVDARDGEIVADGWKTPTGLDLIEAAKAVEPFAGELLFTCVEREGTMTGINLEPVRKLRDAVLCQITVAGGVSTLEEIGGLAAMGCDVQLGNVFFSGSVSLADAFAVSLNWKKGFNADSEALLPIVIQAPDGQVLMTGFSDMEALTETFSRGNVCFRSRSRNQLWMKGETSGHTLQLVRMRADCDRDTLLATVNLIGHVCHTGAWSCFSTDRTFTWEFLQSVVAARLKNPVPGSYTATLDDDHVREKVMEEAEELCEAKSRDEIVWEAADLLYFATVLMSRAGVEVGEVLDELDRRHKH